MKVYLAARYSRREELCGYAQVLREMGHEVTSRWLLGEHQLHDGASKIDILDNVIPMESQPFAQDDYQDVKMADTLIHFTQPADTPLRRGGNLVEFGMALAWDKRVIVCGPRQNIFHTLPEVELHANFRSVMDTLGGYHASRS